MVPQSVVEVVENIELLVVDECELFAEQHEVVGERVHVTMQSQRRQVSTVALVDVRQHVQQQPVNLLHRRLERARECVTCTANQHSHLYDQTSQFSAAQTGPSTSFQLRLSG